MRVQVVAFDTPVDAFFAFRSVQAVLAAFPDAKVDVAVQGEPGSVWEGFRTAVPGVTVAGAPAGPGAVPAGALLRPGQPVAFPEDALAAWLADPETGPGDVGGFLDIRGRINAVGLLDLRFFDEAMRAEARTLNHAFRSEFDNRLFWSYRYAVDPQLGSGKGSRGVFVTLKRHCLKRAGIESARSVLDVGCGDLEVVNALSLKGYLGLDLAETALDRARALRPDWAFEVGMVDPDRHGPRDVVLCLDVLIHQRDPQAFATLVQGLVAATGQRLIVSGYEASAGPGYMIGFHEPLSQALAATGAFDRIEAVTRYRGTTLLVADRPESTFPPAATLDTLEIGEILFDHLDGLGL
ncbi:MAG: hypothetical protein CMH12_02240 [Maritimibacter sp.]|nr:hypothetical protein [Maritimibacter sp.]